ncbi:hypothetical protein [Caballeronia sp. Lep1P3]|uniref:hypothetical protein n=1 Tax=Caballeronia sp. Lep1P3 TaxID=2878150 RepID=UPI001FD267AB|nr:hypothetical protein [Caballeronia sp. Lep1P3]
MRSPPIVNAGGAPDVTLSWLRDGLGALSNKDGGLSPRKNESALQATSRAGAHCLKTLMLPAQDGRDERFA